MMKFENVEGKNVVEQINIISTEIMEEYPTVDPQDVIKIAALCETVGDEVTEDDIFRRYYYILLYLGKGYPLYNKIFLDMNSICFNKLKDNINNLIYNDIVRYNNNEILSFPKICDYYE